MLSLRPLNPKDTREVRFVNEVRSHPEVTRWLLTPPLPRPQGEDWIRKHVDHVDRSIFILELEEDPIGFAQFTRKEHGELELGWALHPDYHHKGHGREAVWAWVAYAARFPDQFLSLTVKSLNAGAFKLYTETGFNVSGIDPKEAVYMKRENDLQSATLTYVGHAGFQLEYDGVRLLCDPWFNSAFYDSWTPHPPNAHVLSHLETPTHVYISHAHEDHFDRKFLSTLNRDTTMIVPHWLAFDLEALGFWDITALKDGESTWIGAGGGEGVRMNLTLFADERKRDSAILIETQGKRILNLNDCHLPVEKLPKADVLFCQFSGAFHYPHCYDFDPAAMHDKIHDVRERYLDQLIENARATGAKLYIPSSGPPWLSDPKLNRSDSIFYRWHQEGVAERFQECVASEMEPGDELLIGDHLAWIRRPKWFLLECVRERIRYELPRYVRRLNMKHRKLLTARPKSFYLEVGRDAYLVYMNGTESVVFNRSEVTDDRANYTIRVRPEMMLDILKGGRWDAAFLSNKIKLHRDRDVYDAELFQILYRDRHDDPAIDLEENPQMIQRHGYLFQRYCPHAGHDLSESSTIELSPVLGDSIECPRHKWRWDLKTGKCIKGGEQPIKCEALEPMDEV